MAVWNAYLTMANASAFATERVNLSYLKQIQGTKCLHPLECIFFSVSDL